MHLLCWCLDSYLRFSKFPHLGGQLYQSISSIIVSVGTQPMMWRSQENISVKVALDMSLYGELPTVLYNILALVLYENQY